MLVLFSKCARIAQLVEQRPLKAKVSGPIPDAGTKICETNFAPNNASLPAGRQGIRTLEEQKFLRMWRNWKTR